MSITGKMVELKPFVKVVITHCTYDRHDFLWQLLITWGSCAQQSPYGGHSCCTFAASCCTSRVSLHTEVDKSYCLKGYLLYITGLNHSIADHSLLITDENHYDDGKRAKDRLVPAELRLPVQYGC